MIFVRDIIFLIFLIFEVSQIISDYDPEGKNLYAFDIGPGNCLIDEWVRNNSTDKFDKDGEISKSGKVDNLILNQALDNFELIYMINH